MPLVGFAVRFGSGTGETFPKADRVMAAQSPTEIGICSRSADRGGRVAPSAADPSQATGRVKRHDNQLHRARVLEVRIQSPPAESPSNLAGNATDARSGLSTRMG